MVWMPSYLSPAIPTGSPATLTREEDEWKPRFQQDHLRCFKCLTHYLYWVWPLPITGNNVLKRYGSFPLGLCKEWGWINRVRENNTYMRLISRLFL
jgi:hypothetical protein